MAHFHLLTTFKRTEDEIIIPNHLLANVCPAEATEHLNEDHMPRKNQHFEKHRLSRHPVGTAVGFFLYLHLHEQ
jgi:hypothetical protein